MCSLSNWGPCKGEITPRFEVCDGTDRDCDGTITAKASVGNPCVTTYAGWPFPSYKDGSPTIALFYRPQGLAFDKAGNLYIADSMNNRIRKIDTNGTTTTFAGTGKRGFKDGLANQALFHYPQGLAFDNAGNLHTADSRNHRIRKIIISP